MQADGSGLIQLTDDPSGERHWISSYDISGNANKVVFTSGVDYLDETTRYRIFTDLWEVRTLLLPTELRPELSNAEDYGFRD